METLGTSSFQKQGIRTAGSFIGGWSAIIDTSDDENDVGKLTQVFKVNVGEDTLVGRIRFVSDEWPTWYGTMFNDAYVVYIITPDGLHVLAAGNLNSSSWGGGIAGFNGLANGEVNVTFNVTAFQGRTIKLVAKVYDVGDKIINSGIVLSNFKIINDDNRNLYEEGVWKKTELLQLRLGQAVWITVENFGVNIQVIEIWEGDSHKLEKTLWPDGVHTFSWSKFGDEPMDWTFKVFSKSLNFNMGYKIESTWVPGMNPNP